MWHDWKKWVKGQHVITPLACGAMAACLFVGSSANAAAVNFGSATTISDDSILDAGLSLTDGALVEAVSFGATATVTTANQVIAFSNGNVIGNANMPAAASVSTGVYNAGTQSGVTIVSSGDADFDTILASDAWHNNASDTPQALTLRINGLTDGQAYAVYLFTADNRGGSAGRTQAYWDGFDGNTFSGNSSGSFSQNDSSSVVGTFIADSSGYQDIFIQETDGSGNDDTHLSGYVLYSYTVPEPASLALVGLGGLVMVARRRHA